MVSQRSLKVEKGDRGDLIYEEVKVNLQSAPFLEETRKPHGDKVTTSIAFHYGSRFASSAFKASVSITI